MKIAVIRQKYVNYGGAEKLSVEFARLMAKAGHEIHIFANQWSPSSHPNIHFHKVPVIKLNSYLRFLSFAWFAKQQVKRERFDIIQSHERTLCQDIFWAADGSHKEWLERRREYLFPAKRLLVALNPFHRLVLKYEKAIFAQGNYKKIVAISEMVKKNILKHYDIPQDDIVVFYNGVNLEKFHPRNKTQYRDPIRKQLDIPEHALLLMYTGSGFERKGLKFLLQSLEFLEKKEWRLLAVGKGNWKRYLAFAPAEAREKIICLDPVNDIEKYYAAADVFILPSIYDPFGIVSLEAQAASLPVVVSRFCGAAEIIEHGHNGLVVEDPGRPREIAEKINLLFDPSLRQRMGEEARKLAENYPDKNFAEQIIGLYKELVG
ncbi:MAG: glycosyltransferase family 4 protein [Nitrospinales bacterium]